MSALLVTNDGALWTSFTAVIGAVQARQFDSVAELIAGWPRNRPAVVILDARSVGELAVALESLGAHNATFVPVALVEEAQRERAVGLERQRRLFEHLLLPLDPGTAKTVLEHAAEEASARGALQAGDPPPSAAPAEPMRADSNVAASPAPIPAVVEPPPRRRQKSVAMRPASAPAPIRARPQWIAIGVAVTATVVLAAGYALWKGGSARPKPVPSSVARLVTPAIPSPLAARASVDEAVIALLDRARAAMRDRRYIDPADDNALAHYKAALALEATNGEARQGLERIAELLIARAGASLAARDNAAALRSLEAARAIAPGHPRLAVLDAEVGTRAAELSTGQVQAAIQAGAFGRAAQLLAQGEKAGTIAGGDVGSLRQEIARRTAVAQIVELERLVQTRISQGQLIEPAGDSAKSYLTALAERGGASIAEDVARLTDLYQKRTITEARAAMAAGAWTQADAWVGELRATKGGAPIAQPLQKELERRVLDARAAEQARVASPPTEPAVVPAPAAPQVQSGSGIVTPAHLAKPLKVNYPRVATGNNASGWVMVEADVDGNGRVGGVRVLDAQPKGVFDAAARTAVERATFAPATAADGSHPGMTVSMRVRFQLDDQH